MSAGEQSARAPLCRQCALFKVLVAYAACDVAVDYVQSMADNAAILLVHLEDASAFWALVRLMQPHGRYRLRTMYTTELPRVHLLKAELEELVRKRKPQFTRRYLRLSAELYPPCARALSALTFPCLSLISNHLAVTHLCSSQSRREEDHPEPVLRVRLDHAPLRQQYSVSVDHSLLGRVPPRRRRRHRHLRVHSYRSG